ncbi:MAG: hypothetical protein L6V88_07695 [Anaerotruncus sp.]|nr:MAG: hypothetical protein L6V88_07695 [Anaerotruncus sp.]
MIWVFMRAYGDYREPVAKIANHRILAVNRGEKEGFLKVSLDVDKSSGLGVLTGLHVKKTIRRAWIWCAMLPTMLTHALFSQA